MPGHTPTEATAVEYLTRLVYELLDAHEDTTALAAELRGDLPWAAHLEYLRELQRVARGILAEVAVAPSEALPQQL